MRGFDKDFFWMENSSGSGASWRQRLLRPTGINWALTNPCLGDTQITCLAYLLVCYPENKTQWKKGLGEQNSSEVEGLGPKVKLMAIENRSSLMNSWPPRRERGSERDNKKGDGSQLALAVTIVERSQEPGLGTQPCGTCMLLNCVWLPRLCCFCFFMFVSMVISSKAAKTLKENVFKHL